MTCTARRRSTPEEGGEPVTGAVRSRRGDWRPEEQVPAGAIAERPGRVSGQVPVLRGRVQPEASGFDALTERGQGFAGVP
jgi:hypothetical protein